MPARGREGHHGECEGGRVQGPSRWASEVILGAADDFRGRLYRRVGRDREGAGVDPAGGACMRATVVFHC